MSDRPAPPRITPLNRGVIPEQPPRAAGTRLREGMRVDPPHQFGDPPVPVPTGARPVVEYDIVEEPVVEPARPVPTRSESVRSGPARPLPVTSEQYQSGAYRTESPSGDPLLQARQIAEHLQKRYADLHRREQRLNSQLSELDQERRTFRMWVAECESVLLERDEDLQQRDAYCAERESACLNLEHELQSRKADVLQQERDLEEIQDRWRAEWELERTELQRDLDQQRIAFQNEQAQFRLVKEGQLAEIQQERTLLLNRIRFQEDHLRKLRQEFEVAQSVFHQEKQRIQSSQLAADELLRSRAEQLHKFRGILDERETAIHRQLSALAKARRASIESLDRDLSEFETERANWLAARDRQRAEMQRKAEILRLNAENLESRQKRLEQLRSELEETHRKTLEMRLSVEEACAQLAQAVGPEVARERIENAQHALSEHYQIARDMLQRQRMEVEQFQATVLKQRGEFHAEQQSIAEWIAKRDEELRLRESSLKAIQQEAGARERNWQSTRERWLHEKLEAETAIRELLRRVEEQTAPSGNSQ